MYEEVKGRPLFLVAEELGRGRRKAAACRRMAAPRGGRRQG